MSIDKLRNWYVLSLVAISLNLGGFVKCQTPLPERNDSENNKPMGNVPPVKRKYLGEIEGRVLDIGKTSITIRPFKHENERLKIDYFTGMEEPMKLTLMKSLADGNGPTNYPGVQKPFEYKFCYRRTDVKKGDTVDLICHEVDGDRVCQAICIRRRADGPVPVAPGDVGTLRFPHHTRMSIDQSFEEKGTPIPERWGGTKREKELMERMQKVKAILDEAKAADLKYSPDKR